MRLWLALMFAAIGILTGTSVYLFVSQSSEKAAEDTASQLAQGRALQLSGELGAKKGKFADTIIAQYRSAAFAPWVFNRYDELITDRDVEIADQTLAQVPNQRLARKKAANGRRFVSEFEAGLTVVALPIYRDDKVGPDGVVLVQADCPAEVSDALAALRGERLTALALAVPSPGSRLPRRQPITSRVKRLAAARGGWPRAIRASRCTRAAATRSATSAAPWTRCARRSRDVRACSPPSAIGSRRSSTALPRR